MTRITLSFIFNFKGYILKICILVGSAAVTYIEMDKKVHGESPVSLSHPKRLWQRDCDEFLKLSPGLKKIKQACDHRLLTEFEMIILMCNKSVETSSHAAVV